MSERLGKLQKDILCYMQEFTYPVASGNFVAQLFDTHRDSATRALRKLASEGYITQCPATEAIKGLQGNSKAYWASDTHNIMLVSKLRKEGMEIQSHLKSLKEKDKPDTEEIKVIQAKLGDIISRFKDAKQKREAAKELWTKVTPKLKANWADHIETDIEQLRLKALDTICDLPKTGKAA